MISKSNWGWIFTATFFIFSMLMLGKLRETESRLTEVNQTLDSLRNEIELKNDQLEVREEQVSLLMQLNSDNFDRIEDIEKMQRLFSE
jgi:hypothetical protein